MSETQPMAPCVLRSMTGYGRGEAGNGDVVVVVELKSVNNRFRDIQLRVPREYMALEPRVMNVMKDPFRRGRIEAYVRRKTLGVGTTVQADTKLADAYINAINSVAEGAAGFVDRDVPLSFVVSQPGVLHIEEAEVDVMVEWPVVQAAVEAAIKDLMEMREAEGRALYVDLKQHLDEFNVCLADVEAAASGLNDRIRQKLEARMRKMIGDRFDPYRIIQEAALLADKSDISEEIARLRSHCDQFGDALDKEDSVGRRLDFLLQEMHREVNTIGSKAVDHPVSQRVVEMKTVLERMREQSANVE